MTVLYRVKSTLVVVDMLKITHKKHKPLLCCQEKIFSVELFSCRVLFSLQLHFTIFNIYTRGAVLKVFFIAKIDSQKTTIY
jgi:hypothetical protein